MIIIIKNSNVNNKSYKINNFIIIIITTIIIMQCHW